MRKIDAVGRNPDTIHRRPAAGLLAPANLVTAARVGAIAHLVCAPDQWGTGWTAAGAFVFFYWLTDLIDGTVARLTGTASRFGESLDLTADRLCDLLLAVHLIATGNPASGLAWAYVVVRFPADVVVGRLHGQADGVYGRAAARILGRATLPPAWRRTGLELVHLSRAAFFADALFGLAIPGVRVPFAAFIGAYALFLVLLFHRHAREAA